MIKHDNIHLDGRRLDSYDKPFNFFITERETGKSSWAYTKMYKTFIHRHRPSILIRRRINDITDIWINDVGETINQFLKTPIELDFKKGSIKEGVVDVYIKTPIPHVAAGKVFFRVIALSNPKSRIKSLVVEDPAYIIFDEYILDTQAGEKWLPGEAGKFQDLYKTFSRHAIKYGHQLRCYFLGNPYSVYSPYMTWLEADLTAIKPGAFIVGKQYVIDCQQLSPELRKFLIEKDPLYQFDNSFTKYLFGTAVNDTRFPIIPQQPPGYKLKYIYRFNHRNIGIFYQDVTRAKAGYDCGKYWICILENYKGSRDIFACDFDNLVEGTRIVTTDMHAMTWRLRDAIGSRDVTYQTIECGYLIEGIFTLL